MSRGRLAIFLPSFTGGGAERMMLHLSRGLAERNFEVDLVVARAEGPYRSQLPNDVRLVDLDASKALGYGALGNLLPIVRYLRRTRPKVFLSVMARVNVVAILATTLARTNTRIVVSERNHLSSYVSSTDEFGVRVLPWLVRATYPLADGIIPISVGVADDLAQTAHLDRDAMTVVYNPVVTPEIRRRSREPVDHHWFDDDSPVVLGAGSLSPQKDFPTLIRAFGHLTRNREARLVILGEGNERDHIESLVRSLGLSDRVWLPGFVDNPFAYMKRADVFTLSSAWEGFGNVIVEALACGTPVVSTDCPSGPSEILQDGRIGPLIPVGDERKLADAISTVLDDPPPEELLTGRAQDFRYDNITDEYLDVLV